MGLKKLPAITKAKNRGRRTKSRVADLKLDGKSKSEVADLKVGVRDLKVGG